MPLKDSIFQGVLFINGGTKGFSEKHFLIAEGFSDALTKLERLAKWRASLMAHGFELAYARVSKLDAAKRAKLAIVQPINPLTHGATTEQLDTATAAGFGVVNKTEDSIICRQECLDGKWRILTIGGVPDNKISDDELVGTFMALVPNPPADPPANAWSGTTWLECLKNYLSWVKLDTQHVTEVGQAPGEVAVDTWDKLLFRRPAIRQRGRPFDTSRGRR